MAEKLWIFGDSYADPDCDYDTEQFVTWPKQLAKKYDVKNFATGGTGPQWSFEKFINERDRLCTSNSKNAIKKQTSVLFLLSAYMRLPFAFHKHPSMQWSSTLPDQKKFREITHTTKWHYEWLRAFHKFYIMNPDFSHWHKTESMKYVYLLNELSHEFKKIHVINIFKHSKLDYYPIRKQENFFLTVEPLADTELGYEKYKERDGFDTRPNHFSEVNHNAMADAVINWMENNQQISFEKFQKNP